MTGQFLAWEDLQAHLLAAFELLRARINPSAWRNHFFALFFLKREHDVFAERCREIMQAEIAAGRPEAEAQALAEDPDEHRFYFPPEARWPGFASATENAGVLVERALSALENRNLHLLSGVLSKLRFSKSMPLEEEAPSDSLLPDLLAHFDKIPLEASRLYSPDLIGLASTHLVEKFSEAYPKKPAGFSSPAPLMRLLAELLRPEAGMRICDPFCGAGGALLACCDYLASRGENPQNLSLFGEEIDPATWALCKMNLLLHDLPDHRLWCGSCITAPALTEDHQLQRFDLVVTEPPFSLPEAEYEEAAKDPWNRFGAGLPSPKRGELVYVQHVAAILNEKGRAAVVVPHGVLFRGGIEGKIRAAMMQPEVDLIEAVISLPGGLLHATPAPSAILILNRDKPPDRRGKVLFMDAAGLVEKDDLSQALVETSLLKLTALYHAFGERALLPEKLEGLIREWRTAADWARKAVEEISPKMEERVQLAQAAWQVRQQEIAVAAMAVQKWLADRESCERCATVATLEEIAGTQGHNLNFARYLSGRAGVKAENLTLELHEIRKLESQRAEIEAEMNRLLQELGTAMRQ